MCGFAGGLLFHESLAHDQQVLKNMSDVLTHRGPDDSGMVVRGCCALVHRRLSVIDLSPAGHQPMCNEDGTVWLAYNGEVYNFKELRSRYGLDGKGHVFRSATDTEVLIHLYEELGEDFLKELNGMFSLALWDMKREKLLLARDPFGVKPLFYTRTSDGIWFASEIKSLLEVPGVNRKPSLESLSGFLAFDYVPGALTPFEGIHELLPGKSLAVMRKTGETEERCFFQPDYTEDNSITAEDACAQSREVLEKSVERALISDVPVGVMLSGGMDSSALTALMAGIRGNADFHTFSLGFQERSFDESRYAALVSESIGTIHHRIAVTPEKVADLLPGYLAHIDEPYADGSAIPTWLLAEEASRHVTVLLSGEGGDEVYTGYDTHAAYKARKLYRKLVPGFIRTGIIKKIVHQLPVSQKKLSFEFKARRFTEGAEYGIPESHFFWRAVLSQDARREVLKNSDELKGFPAPETLYRKIYDECRADSELNRLLCIDTSCHLPHDLMVKNDRMTMAHSVEARVPFTDMELFRYLAKVPVKHKFPCMEKKALLRRSMAGVLPREVVKKKKVGLEMPYSRWMRNELKEITLDHLSPGRLNATGLFNPAGVERLWKEHESMRADHGRALWGLLNYMIWHEMYIDSNGYKNHINPGVVRR